MSCQRGNTVRSRPQKYQNGTVFKNTLHDKTQKTKFLNSLDIANVCERCKKIIEWKIKYKKYKPLKAPATCTKCQQKAVKHTYHIMCLPCAKKFEVCAKCGQNGEIIDAKPSKEHSLKLDAELQTLLKGLPERKRRTFIRYMNKNDETKNKKAKTKKNIEKNAAKELVEKDESEHNTNEVEEHITRDSLLQKLKSLALSNEENDDIFGSDFSDSSQNSDDEDEDEEEDECEGNKN